MERWNRRLQGYDFEAVYTQGSQIPSDYLSHHAMPDKGRQRSPVEGYINFLVVPKAMTLKFRNETKPYNAYPDWFKTEHAGHKISNLPTEYQEVNKSELILFSKIKDELTVNDWSDIVLCIAVPTELLLEKAIVLVYEDRQGLVKIKRLLKEKVWCPGIDQCVKRRII